MIGPGDFETVREKSLGSAQLSSTLRNSGYVCTLDTRTDILCLLKDSSASRSDFSFYRGDGEATRIWPNVPACAFVFKNEVVMFEEDISREVCMTLKDVDLDKSQLDEFEGTIWAETGEFFVNPQLK